MANIQLQDLTAVITGTSRYNGNQYDTVTVKTLLVTNEAITDKYYVPNGTSPTSAARALLAEAGLEVMPYNASKLTEGTEDIQKIAKEGNFVGTLDDARKLILLSLLKEVYLTPINVNPNGQHVYELTYEHKIYPIAGGDEYEFNIQIPFSGLVMNEAGGRVELTVMLPRAAQTIGEKTRGTDEAGQNLEELVFEMNNVARQVVTFEYHKDPVFKVAYRHTLVVQA